MVRTFGFMGAVGCVGIVSLGATPPNPHTTFDPTQQIRAVLALPSHTTPPEGAKRALVLAPREEKSARLVAPPGPSPRPKPVPPTVPSANPIQKHLKKNKVLYRLDDRIDGSLRCDAWKVIPSQDDANQGLLFFQYRLKTDQKKVSFTYGYQASLGPSAWLFSISGQEKVELYGGVSYRQNLSCSESYELGAARAGEFEIGEGVWYSSKRACEKARKTSAPKSPGGC
jgi:hypothetical protein